MSHTSFSQLGQHVERPYLCVIERVYTFDTKVINGTMYLVAVVVPKSDATKWFVTYHKLSEMASGS